MNPILAFDVIGSVPRKASELTALRPLIDAANRSPALFTSIVGSPLEAGSLYGEERLQLLEQFIARFHKPVIYTPCGDEWFNETDCAAGINQLIDLRHRLWSSTPATFGAYHFIQQRNARGLDYPENRYWCIDNVALCTLHTTRHNDHSALDAFYSDEFSERNQANLDWLTQAFSAARRSECVGLVVITHANLWQEADRSSGLRPLLRALKRESKRFEGWVLVVHGSQRRLVLDQPCADTRSEERGFNHLFRLGVMGNDSTMAAHVVINPLSQFPVGVHLLLANAPARHVNALSQVRVA